MLGILCQHSTGGLFCFFLGITLFVKAAYGLAAVVGHVPAQDFNGRMPYARAGAMPLQDLPPQLGGFAYGAPEGAILIGLRYLKRFE